MSMQYNLLHSSYSPCNIPNITRIIEGSEWLSLILALPFLPPDNTHDLQMVGGSANSDRWEAGHGLEAHDNAKEDLLACHNYMPVLISPARHPMKSSRILFLFIRLFDLMLAGLFS